MSARLVELAAHLARGERLTSAFIRREYGVSKATAKRDMIVLAEHYPTSPTFKGRGPYQQRILRRAV